jgi:hypothetical protein
MRTTAVALLLTTALCWTQPARADEPNRAAAPAGSATEYQGVTLFSGEPPAPKPPPAGYQVITWPGFTVTDQGSEVFLQMSGPVNYAVKAKGRRVWVTMDRVQVMLKNNLRRVITRHFPNTPVTSFRLRPVKKKDQVRLTIKLRRKATPTVDIRSKGQYSFLVVSFPPTR